MLVTGWPAMNGAEAGSAARQRIAGLARLSARAVPTKVPPVPIEVLDPAKDLAPGDLDLLYADFLKTADSAGNPYLSPPRPR